MAGTLPLVTNPRPVLFQGVFSLLASESRLLTPSTIGASPPRPKIISAERQTQWKRRFERLQTLRERLAAHGRYDRAHKAYLLIQAGIDRWADEVFSAKRA